ncbi:FUSC family protein [Marivita sp. GX14005]|uniref:FUSC family protein n=1 Tax=Marivita sp. GX14005 TaxID=2942276 RepID=UPI002018E694|nr:FUSC family protein [Marivita sp. GX14005]MCL3883257.1 FUSC family protein [Marivita sp. GX14005]
MYVTPRPSPVDDPLYAMRLGLTGTLAYLAIPILNPALPPIIAALPVGLIAAQRKAFNPAKMIAAPIVMIVLTALMTWLVEQMRPMPAVYVGAMWLIYFMAFREILRTGAPLGMLIIIVAVLMSVMGMHGSATVEAMRDNFMMAAIVAFVVGPIVYLVLPARTAEKHIDEPVPSPGNINIGAGIRASVLLLLSFWLYAVMQPADMMMAMVAAMVIVFPTRTRVWDEAMQRVRATFYGVGIAALILFAFTFSQHLLPVLCMLFLAGLYLGQKMFYGRHPSMVYQYAYSVVLSLVAGALSTQDAAYSSFTRIALTIAGAFSAAALVALLDLWTRWFEAHETQNAPAV